MKKNLMNKYNSKIEEIYNEILNTINIDNNPGIELLYESGKYHFSNKGKMLRPLIMISVNDDLGGTFDDIKPFAMALELIHNYSLVHDDLPGMDNDDYRRGQLTVHKKYDEGTAILVGDYFLTKAFEIVSNPRYINNNNLENVIKAINSLSKNANDKGMLGGQVMDLNPEELNSKNKILKMYEYKTSALFKSAFTIPGILLEKEQKELETLKILGRDFGILFQILDDISDRKEDIEEGKITILDFLDEELSKNLIDSLYKNVIVNLEKMNLYNTKKILEDIYG